MIIFNIIVMNIVEYEKNFVIILNTKGTIIRGEIMNIEEIIVELNNYTTHIDKEINKELYKTTQHNIKDGNIGVMINKLLDTNEFEGYLYIKKKDKIACPLMYKKIANEEEADLYFEELNGLINNESIEYIINECKTVK